MANENLQNQLSELAGAVKALKTMSEADPRFQFLNSKERKSTKTANLSLAFQIIKTTRSEISSEIKHQNRKDSNEDKTSCKEINLNQNITVETKSLADEILDKKVEKLYEEQLKTWLMDKCTSIRLTQPFTYESYKHDFVINFGNGCPDPISASQLSIFEEDFTINNIEKMELLKLELDQIMDLCYKNIPELNKIIKQFEEIKKISQKNKSKSTKLTELWKKINQPKAPESAIEIQNLISYTKYFQHALMLLEEVKNKLENRSRYNETLLKLNYKSYDMSDFRHEFYFNPITILVNDFEPFESVKYSQLPEYTSLLLETLKDVEIRIKHELEDSQQQ